MTSERASLPGWAGRKIAIKTLSLAPLFILAAVALRAQAPTSVGGSTLRICGISTSGGEQVANDLFVCIDFASDGTFDNTLQSLLGGPMEDPLQYNYSPPASGTYTYQQISPSEGRVLLVFPPSVANLNGWELDFSTPTSGTIPVSNGPAMQFTLLPTGGVSSERALVNMSILVSAQQQYPTTFGFIVGGTEPREIFIRATGPGLALFGMTNVAANPVYTLTGSAIGGSFTGAPWSAWPDQAATVIGEEARTGTFLLSNGSNDKADVYILPPGAYTISVAPTDASGQGWELVEVYELE